MHLDYNGVSLQLLTLDSVVRESVWTPDGVDLLYVKWKIGASCVYAAGATALQSTPSSDGSERSSFVGTDPSGVTPAQGYVTLPIVTDRFLRQRLFQNRKPLSIWGWDSDGSRKNWIDSPVPPATCDANNGPKIHACNVVSATGAPSNFAVQLEIETCLPPCPTGSDRPLLSHRWQMRHTHDDDFYLTRIVTGQAIFHPGLMDKYQKNPDWFRRQLFHPIPLGFQRKLGPVDLSPDGCVLQYQYSDTDTAIIFDAADSGATRIQIKESAQYIPGNFLKIFGLATPGK